MASCLASLFPAKINDVPPQCCSQTTITYLFESGSTVTACRALENARATDWMTYRRTAGVLTT